MNKFFSKVGNWIGDIFKKLLKEFKEFIDAAIPEIEKIVIAELKDLAIEAVKNANTKDITNEEKRKMVFDTLKKSAKESGKDIKDSVINLLIELAYQHIKNNK